MDENQVKCLHLMGFHRSELIKHPKTHNFITSLVILTVFSCGLVEMVFVFGNTQNVLAAAEACGPFATELIVFSKILTFLISKERFYAMTDRVKNLSTGIPLSDSFDIDRANYVGRTFTLFHFATTAFTGFGYCLVPWFNNLLLYLKGNDLVYEMPLKSTFPYDVTVSPAYELTYAFLCFGVYITILVIVSVDSLFLGACLNICAHFDILRKSFDGDKKKFMIQHEILLNLSDEVNQLFKPIIFVQFLTSSILLCVLGFQLLMLQSFFQRLLIAAYTIVIVSQLFVYSFGGQLLIEKSSSVAEDFYEVDRDFVPIIATAQKGVTITGGFYRASLPELLNIMGTAASLITLLQTLMSKNEI